MDFSFLLNMMLADNLTPRNKSNHTGQQTRSLPLKGCPDESRFNESQPLTNLDFQLNCQIPVNSKYFGILAYYKELLNQKSERRKVRRMIFESVSNYWQPLILLNHNRSQAINIANTCIYRIERKIDELKNEFEPFNDEQVLEGIKTTPKLEFDWGTRISKKNPEELELAHYLKSGKDFNLVEKILWSNDAFYGIIAYQHLNFCEEIQMRKKAQQCIKDLKSHCRFLSRIFPELAQYQSLETTNNSLDVWNSGHQKITNEQTREITHSLDSFSLVNGHVPDDEKRANALDLPELLEVGTKLL